MVENKMAGPGPVRADRVEEPVGYDHLPTERIPAQGDFDKKDTEQIPAQGDFEKKDAEASPAEEQPVNRPEEPLRDSAEPAGDWEELPPPDTAEPLRDTPEPVAGSVEPAGETVVFADGDATRFRNRWRELQADFVDDPTQAVRGADELVDEVMRELAERKHVLEERWRDGVDDTEELRVAMREYRSFFNQLLNA